MNESSDAMSLVVVYLGAFLAPLIAGRLGIPAAVAEMLFGVAVGISGLDWVHPTQFTSFLSQLGFLFLMFLVGLEIDFNHIRREGKKSLLGASLIAFGILATGAAAARIVGFPTYMGLVIGAMSVGVLLVALTETGQLKSRLGQLLLLIGSIGEFLTLCLLTGYNLTHRFGVTPLLFLEIGRALLLFAVAYALLSLLRLAVWWAPHSFQRLVHSSDPSEIGVRTGLVLMLVLATLAHQVGLESILGAFLAGALFSFVFRQRGALDAKLAALGQGFFIPIFFINIGVTFNLKALHDPAGAARLMGILFLTSFLSKGVPMLLARMLGVPFRQTLAGAILLCAPLTLLVAVATLGRSLGLLDESISAAVILFAMASGVLFPVLFRRLTAAPIPALPASSIEKK